LEEPFDCRDLRSPSLDHYEITLKRSKRKREHEAGQEDWALRNTIDARTIAVGKAHELGAETGDAQIVSSHQYTYEMNHYASDSRERCERAYTL